MIEVAQFRKNKINLSDYDYIKDLDNRLLMSEFSTLDLEILEEILYSPLVLSASQLAKNLNLTKEQILPTLQKLTKVQLLDLNSDAIFVDKEVRKYYEAQIIKFDEDFKPNMEFLQGLLKKVPIHILPLWYNIPKTADNIFDSIIEKYLLTPHIFQRYVEDLHFPDPVLSKIVEDVFHAPDFEISSRELTEKYGLSHKQFEEYILYLEFHLICCLSYKKVHHACQEIVTPFYEWRQYLRFLRDTQPESIQSINQIKRKKETDFAYIEDLTSLLLYVKKHPLPLSLTQGKYQLRPESKEALAKVNKDLNTEEWSELIQKLLLLNMADVVDNRLYVLDIANQWLGRTLENRALTFYRYPLNYIQFPEKATFSEKSIREAEKSILRILDSGWVYFDDLIKAAIANLHDKKSVQLTRIGKHWKYQLPAYSEEDIAFLKTILFKWLYELGIIAYGTHAGKDCLRVTSFGQQLFGNS